MRANKKLLAILISIAVVIVCIAVIIALCFGNSQDNSDTKEIIPDISIGMTKEEVFEIAGADYTYSQDNRGYEYKNTVEYGYLLDSIDIFDIAMPAQMFFEFENDTTLVCYGYHIGGTGDYDALCYPYSEIELLDAYDNLYPCLCEWYGESSSVSDNAEYGVIKENSWENESGMIWLIVGVNLWSDTVPDAYENGINEIVLSCSAPERQ